MAKVGVDPKTRSNKLDGADLKHKSQEDTDQKRNKDKETAEK